MRIGSCRPQEYYDEESIVELYQSVLQRLVLTLADEEELLGVRSELPPTALTVPEERLRVWPPWPWPPWGGDDDDGGDDDETEPMTPAKASKLAWKIIDLEKAIANASLDL